MPRLMTTYVFSSFALVLANLLHDEVDEFLLLQVSGELDVAVEVKFLVVDVFGVVMENERILL